jgi:hypothetical protein
MTKKPTTYTENQTYPNYAYDLVLVPHVACRKCIPTHSAWRAMREAGLLIQQSMTTIPCQYCGSYDLIEPEESEEDYDRTEIHHPGGMARL